MYLTGLCRKNSIMDNALVPDQATDWSISLKPGSYTGDTKLQGNSAEFTFAKSSGIVTKDREKDWPIVDRLDPSNNPRNNRGSNFFSNKIPFSFLKRRIAQLKTALFSWVKGERLSYAFYQHFPKKFPWLSKNARKYSGDFWRLPNDAVSSPSNRSRHLTFRTTDWNILGGDWIQVLQFNGLWQVVRNFESRIDVFHLSWLCNELVTLVDSGFVKGHSVILS